MLDGLEAESVRRGQPGEVDRFSRLSSCSSPGGRTSSEASTGMPRAPLAFANLRHL